MFDLVKMAKKIKIKSELKMLLEMIMKFVSLIVEKSRQVGVSHLAFHFT